MTEPLQQYIFQFGFFGALCFLWGNDDVRQGAEASGADDDGDAR